MENVGVNSHKNLEGLRESAIRVIDEAIILGYELVSYTVYHYNYYNAYPEVKITLRYACGDEKMTHQGALAKLITKTEKLIKITGYALKVEITMVNIA